MKDQHVRALIVISFVFVVCFIPALLMGFFGHEARIIWNEAATETTCEITQILVDMRLCSEDCNCYSYCTTNSNGRRSCSQRCSTCYYDCYDGKVLYLNLVEISYTKWFTIIYGERSYNYVNDEMTENYIIGTNDTCYYHPDKPDDFRLTLANAAAYFIGTMIFAVIGGLALVIWTGVELYIQFH